MKRLHIFLACLLLICACYVVFYETVAWNASWNSDPRSLWNFFYMFCIVQGYCTGFYLIATGLSLYKYKMDWDMIELQERRKFDAKYAAKIEKLLKK